MTAAGARRGSGVAVLARIAGDHDGALALLAELEQLEEARA
jgi:hypothetical protein